MQTFVAAASSVAQTLRGISPPGVQAAAPGGSESHPLPGCPGCPPPCQESRQTQTGCRPGTSLALPAVVREFHVRAAGGVLCASLNTLEASTRGVQQQAPTAQGQEQ